MMWNGSRSASEGDSDPSRELGVEIVLHVLKLMEYHLLFLEEEWDRIDGAVPVFGDNDLGDVLLVCVWIVHVFAIDEHHHIGVLLN